MGWIDPRYEENQRRRWLRPDWQRWVRHDAHRFAPPSVQTKSFAARRIEQREVEEQAALAAEQNASRESLAHLRWLVADLKFDVAFRRLQLKYGYNPSQPRAPKGNPDGGQWTAGAGRDGSLVTKPAAMRRGPSDMRPALPLHVPHATPTGPGAPRQRITIINNAQTGMSKVDEATEKLRTTLEDVVNKLPDGSGPGYGTRVHTEFANAVRDQNLRGIGRDGVEQTFPRDVPYGTADSVRTDIILRDDSGEPIAIYDVKTGGATLRAGRVSELLRNSNASPTIPVIEMHVVRGLSLKAHVRGPIESWIILMRVWRPELPDIADPVEGQAPL